MHTTNLRKVGDSVMLAVPPAILDLLHRPVLRSVWPSISRLVVEPTLRPRCRLDELPAQSDAAAEIGAEDRTWFGGKPVGSGLL